MKGVARNFVTSKPIDFARQLRDREIINLLLQYPHQALKECMRLTDDELHSVEWTLREQLNIAVSSKREVLESCLATIHYEMNNRGYT